MAKDQEDKLKTKKITKRSADYSQWYLDVIEAADLAENGPVRGTMVIKPYGYALWENIQKELDQEFKKTGISNAYFPLFIPESFLKREADHVEGFSPELAVVTHAGGKKLEEPLVVRPTSETIINEMFAKWVGSYRDLPILINQWCNIVRWEMRPRLFLRTTEFLWQEGHTAHATQEDADDRAKQMLEIYQNFAQDILAMPVLTGVKTEAEKFAGALRTYTIEAMTQDGKALQAGTSHNLGQNFAKVFGIKYLNKKNQEEYVWQTSWGVSTRLIGGLIMVHADNFGLVVPPKIAPHQVVIVVIGDNLSTAKALAKELASDDMRVKIDERTDQRPGPRYFEWEKKGIPLRIELGEKEVKDKSVVLVRRDNGEKINIKQKELTASVKKLLADIQDNLFKKAKAFREEHTKNVASWQEFKKAIETGNFVEASWCGQPDCEAEIKEETKATIRCLQFDRKKASGKCVKCGQKATETAIFAKSY